MELLDLIYIGTVMITCVALDKVYSPLYPKDYKGIRI